MDQQQQQQQQQAAASKGGAGGGVNPQEAKLHHHPHPPHSPYQMARASMSTSSTARIPPPSPQSPNKTVILTPTSTAGKGGGTLIVGSPPFLPYVVSSSTSTDPKTSTAATAKTGAATSSSKKPPAAKGPKKKLLRVGIVLEDFDQPARAVRGMHHPVSNCQVTALVVLKKKKNQQQPNKPGKNQFKKQLSRSDSEVEQSLIVEPQHRQWEQELKAQKFMQKFQLIDDSKHHSSYFFHHLGGSSSAKRHIKLLYGQDGFDELLSKNIVDAVFVVTSTKIQNELVMAALTARKHVLAWDRTTSPYAEFKHQLVEAQSVNRMIQTSTMFVHSYRIQSFLDSVLNQKEKFGSNIETINAQLQVHYDLLHEVGVSLPLIEGDSVIRRLARYCILCSIILLSRIGSRPISARVVKVEMSNSSSGSTSEETTKDDSDDGNDDDSTDEPISADCIVTFSGNRKLNCHVEYTVAPTRQVLEVRAPDRHATTTDFVIPHPDGLATYRVYDRKKRAKVLEHHNSDIRDNTATDTDSNTADVKSEVDTDEKDNDSKDELEVVKGESIDIMSGPPQDAMMWRRFAELCYDVEKNGYSNSSTDQSNKNTLQVKELADVVLQTKQVLIALEQSRLKGNIEVPVVLEDDILLNET